MENVCVSVIIPVYNSSQYLEKCVKSVINQTLENIEIILVDDCSTDNSYDLCKMLCEQDSRLCLVHCDVNKGVSSVRNAGLDVAAGEYVYFCDSDDYLEQDCLEFLLNLILQDRGYDLSICGFYINNNEVREDNITPVVLNNKEAMGLIIGMNRYQPKGYLWNKLFKRSIILRSGIRFDENIHIGEDSLFCCLYIKHCNKAIYSAVPKYHYCRNAVSVTRNMVDARSMTVLTSHKKIQNCCSGYFDETMDECLQGNYYFACIGLLKRIAPYFTEEQLSYGHDIFQEVRGHITDIFSCSYIKLKRKMMFFALIGLFYFKELVLSIKRG